MHGLLRSSLVVLLALCCGQAVAANLEKLLMPGPLTAAHADLEANCNQCHGTFSGTPQATLCRDCHDDVDADIRQGAGFHGRSPKAAQQDCRQCHSDHQGREANIVGLEPRLFDHALTDFAIKGAHARAECGACHEAGKAHRQAPGQCNDCHADDDPHAGEMGQQCADCHTQNSWRDADFRHQDTKFPLRGKHREVACASCHPQQHYDQAPTQCQGCHALQDAHGAMFGATCDDCHSAEGWKTTRFDHAATGFRLRGRHAQTSCHACHAEASRGQDLPQQCIGCHRGNDFHQGRFGEDCASCHTPAGWRQQQFDHDRDTTFPLQGGHQQVSCDACHAGGVAQHRPAERVCADCHRATDVHGGTQGDRCERCHNQTGWDRDVRFDHDLTRFPLLGLHAIAPCAECHLDSAYGATTQACAGCHRDADVHDGGLGERCDACHQPSGWDQWHFDHDTQTNFKLTGAHEDASCRQCHARPAGATPTDSACVSCHADDDIHRGRFGANCASCHQPTAFRELTISQPGRFQP